MMKKLLVILFLGISLKLIAAEPYLFKLWDMSNGLSDNTVKCIGQDKFGFWWLGTFDGLCRFDGKAFTVFRHEPDNNHSLSDNEVSALACSETGIWVGTIRELMFYSFTDNRFHTCYKIKGKALTNIKSCIVVKGQPTVVLDAKGTIYIHVRDCLFQKFECKNKWFSISHFRGSLYWAHASSGLYLLDLLKGTVISYSHYAVKGTSEVIYYSRNQKLLYVGFGLDGITDVFKITGTRPQKIKMKVPEHIKTVLDYKKATLFGTDGDGLIKLEDGTYTSFLPTNSTLGSDAIFSLYNDIQDNLFVGTYRGGLNVYSPQYSLFQYLSLSNNRLTQNLVTAVYQRGKKIYIGLDGGGLNIYDKKTGFTKCFCKENSSLPENNLLSISGDVHGLWMGLYKRGLSFYSFNNESFKNYPLPDSGATLWCVKDDGRGFLWIAGSRTYRFDKQTKKYEEIRDLRGMTTSAICFDGKFVWISTNGYGVCKLNTNGRLLKRYTFKKNFFYDNNIKFIAVDSRHRKWVATEGAGIFLLSEDVHGVPVWTKLKDGVFQQKMTCFAEERPGIYWIGTFNGLFRYDERSETSVKFTKNNNLPSIRFNYNASFKGDDGNMYLGTIGGLAYFKPKLIRLPSYPIRVILTGIRLTDDKNTFINLYGDTGKVIHLPYNKNFFTIRFSAPEIGYSDQTRYRYYMKHFDNAWRTVKSAQAEYTNLPQGKYDFYVCATSLSGTWSNEVTSFHLVVTPPWWKTWWAYLLWLILIMLFVSAVCYFYMRNVKIKHKLHIQSVKRKAEERIHRLKMDFLINIVHELRTPVFLISAPLEELSSSGKKVIQAPLSYIQGIYHNALRLTKLLDQIIDFRKIELGALRLDLKYLDVVNYCKELSVNFSALCRQRHISFLYHSDKLFIRVEIDPSKLDLILSNLVSHAFNYTPEGGSVSLSITEKDNYVVFVVKDNSEGMSPIQQNKVSGTFSQVCDDSSAFWENDIRLSFVKQLVELHGGTIMLKSEENVGREFVFTIPLKQTDLSKSKEITTNAAEIQEKEYAEKIRKEEVKVIRSTSPATVYSVLIIDNDADMVSMLENYLNTDFKIYHASNGEEGFQKAQNLLPDIIITDLIISEKYSFHFISKLKKDKKTSVIPIIVLTGNTSEEAKLQLFENGGAEAYLTKPVLLKYLRERMDYILQQSEEKRLNTDTSFIERTTFNKEEQAFLLRCRTIIDDNLTNSDFNVHILADNMGMSQSSLYRKIKELKGMSVIAFITDYRLFKAVQYFRKGESNINSVCDKCGFSDPKNFRTVFKRKFKMTPRDFIKHL